VADLVAQVAPGVVVAIAPAPLLVALPAPSLLLVALPAIAPARLLEAVVVAIALLPRASALVEALLL
jgi:hypothetical protein